MKQATLTGKQARKILEVFKDTPSEQVQVVLGSGLLADLRDANIAAINRDEFRRVCNLGPQNSTFTRSKHLLEPLGTVVIPATTERFFARDRFVVNTSHDAPVKISYHGDNFKEWFLNGVGKVEEPAGEQTLRYARLCQFSMDSPIIAELGGEAKVEATLSAVFFLMEKQRHGQKSVLLVDGHASIFYVKDTAGALRAVRLRWYSDGWDMGAGSVEGPRVWIGGGRVFSRNS